LLAKPDDPTLVAALEKYHRAGKTSNSEIKDLLFAEKGIEYRYV